MMGGLTTFSTFSYETIGMLNGGEIGLGVVNIGLNLGLSLIGVVVGMAIARTCSIKFYKVFRRVL